MGNQHPLGLLCLRSSQDRKSTRLNSSHGYISYAVFCLKKKNNSDLDRATDLNTATHDDQDPLVHPTSGVRRVGRKARVRLLLIHAILLCQDGTSECVLQ